MVLKFPRKPYSRLLLFSSLVFFASLGQMNLTFSSAAFAHDKHDHTANYAVGQTMTKEIERKIDAQIAAAFSEEGSGFKGIVKLDIMNIAPSRALFLPNPGKGKVTVQLLASTVEARVPGRFNFYFAAPEMNDLFHTVSEPAGKKVKKGALIKDGIAIIETGKLYTLQVVYENPTDKEVKFLVNAPLVDPAAALPLARAKCWCAAIPFSVPAKGTFSRTIQVGVGSETPAGAKVIIEWPVISLD